MATFVPAKCRPAFGLSTSLYIASWLCLLLTEAFMIRGLWFHSVPAFHRLRGFDLPFLVWIPAVGAFCFLQFIRLQTRRGQISPALADNISTAMALLLLVTYLLITRFAQIVFR